MPSILLIDHYMKHNSMFFIKRSSC